MCVKIDHAMTEVHVHTVYVRVSLYLIVLASSATLGDARRRARHTVKMGLRPPQRYSEKTDLEFTCIGLARFDTCYKIREGQRTGELQPLLVDEPFRIYHAKGVWSCKWQKLNYSSVLGERVRGSVA